MALEDRAIEGGALKPVVLVPNSELEAGEAIGEVLSGTPADVIEIVLTLSHAVQYGVGDVFFATIPIPNFFRAAGGRTMLADIFIIDDDDQKGAFDLLFFKSNQSIGAANAVASLTDTIMHELVGWASITAADYKDWGSQSTVFLTGKDSGMKLPILEDHSGTQTLWMAGVSQDTKTHTLYGVRLRLSLLHA